jgi:hypothetical protein
MRAPVLLLAELICMLPTARIPMEKMAMAINTSIRVNPRLPDYFRIVSAA